VLLDPEELAMARLIQGGIQNDDPGEAVLANLRYSLQILAAEPRNQIDHFLPPGFTFVADEMALDFDNWSKAVGSYWRLTEEQTLRLKGLHDVLDMMSGEANADLWTVHELTDNPQWNMVRSLAQMALKSFDWPLETPPREQYIDGPHEGRGR
jgi:hypothetical protein